MEIFISYSSKNRDIVEALATDIEALGHNVWIDKKLSGGREWWADILDHIRTCDLFVFALTQPSLDSQACRLEYNYASALNKRILPVMLTDIKTSVLPSALQVIQHIDYRQRERNQVIALSRALANLPPSPPLPDPLPIAPEAPLTPLARLRDRVDALSLSLDDQKLLVFELSDLIRKDDTAEGARELLLRLRDRNDLLAKIEKDIVTLLGTELQQQLIESTAPSASVPFTAPSINSSIVSGDYLDRILQDKVIRVGCVKHPPLCDFNYQNSNCTFSGFYVEMCTIVGQNNNLKVDYVDVDWSDIPDRVFTEMNLDLVLSVFETSRRAEKGDFTGCFFKVRVTGITQKGNTKIASIEDLQREDVRIVVTKGEAGWEYATRELNVPKHRLVVMENSNLVEMMDCVLQKRVDVAICDEVSCYEYAAEHPEVDHILRGEEIYICKNCIMIPKGQVDFKKWVMDEFSKARKTPSVQALENEILGDPRKLIRRYM